MVWWDPADQDLAERTTLERGDLGRGWQEVPMVNNVERLDPLGDDPGSTAVRDARLRRRITALDEGRAWRQRTGGSLAVLRLEVFANANEQDHRAAWRHHAEDSLDATWRTRWRERDVAPGWIESRWVDTSDRPDLFEVEGSTRTDGDGSSTRARAAIDWLRIEDHTDPAGDGQVTAYEHLTVWAGRFHVTVTIRHDLDHPVDEVAARAAAVLWRRLVSP